jgi:predicted RNA-binding protein YlqC (UPF0109 family)
MIIELIKHVVTKLVDSPEAITLAEVAKEENTVIELRVAPEDLGKVIGKEGRTARSLRTLVQAAAKLEKKTAVLEILE